MITGLENQPSRQITLEDIAQSYRDEGFTVTVHPQPTDLPNFLLELPIELLAQKEDRIVALRRKGYEDEQPEEHEVVDVDGGRTAALTLIEEAENLLTPYTVRSALVMGWSAFEAAARVALHGKCESPEKISAGQWIPLLVQHGHIADWEMLQLKECLDGRNALVSGLLPDREIWRFGPFLLDLAKRLLGTEKQTPVRFWESTCGSQVIRQFEQYPKMKEFVKRGNEILADVVNGMDNDVLVSWDIVEVAKSKLAVVLRFSTTTGIAAAVFAPEDFADTKDVFVRINSLWGDVLRLRSNIRSQFIQKQIGKWYGQG